MVPAPILAPATDARIAQIGQMVGLGAVLDQRILHLDEIADMGVVADGARRDAAAQKARRSPDAPPRRLRDAKRRECAPRRAPVTPGPNTIWGSICTSASSTVS